MPSTSLPPEGFPRIHVDNVFGVTFIANIVAAVLYGFGCLGTLSVYRKKRDRPWFRTLIGFLWVVDTFHLFAISGALYFYLITEYGNPAGASIHNFWSATGYYVSTAIMEFSIRGVFTFRVWKLSNNSVLLTAAIVALSLVNWVGNIIFTVKNYTIKTFPNIDSIAWTFYIAFSASVLADLLTAVSLYILLRKHQTGFSRTDTFLKKLMIYSVNTGAAFSLCSLVVLITYIVAPHTYFFVAFYFILPGIMFNSLLVTVRASRRQWEHARSDAGDLVNIPLSTVRFSSMNTVQHSTPNTSTATGDECETPQSAAFRHVPQTVIPKHKMCQSPAGMSGPSETDLKSDMPQDFREDVFEVKRDA